MAHLFACVQLESEECICIFVVCGCIVHICLHMFKVKSVFAYMFVVGVYVLRTFVCTFDKGTSCHGAHVSCECIVYVCCACIVHMFTFVMGAYHSMKWL